MLNFEVFSLFNLKEIFFLTEIFLSCSILQFTFYAIATTYQQKKGFILLNTQVYYVGLIIIILSLSLLFNQDFSTINFCEPNNAIINDCLSLISRIIICFISFTFLIIINVSRKNEFFHNNFEYIILIILSVIGLLLLCSANDFITSYLAIELHSVAFYVMAGFKKTSSYSIESGLKYFIIGTLSSTLFLFGSSLIYTFTGSLLFKDFKTFFSLVFTPNIEARNDSMCSFSIFHLLLYHTLFVQYNPLIELPKHISTDDLFNWNGINNKDINFLVIFENLVYSHLNSNLLTLKLSQIIFKRISYEFFFTNLIINKFVNLQFVSEFIFNEFSEKSKLQFLKQIFNLYSFSFNMLSDLLLFNYDLIIIGVFFITVGLFIKLSIVPFHFWSIDVYEGSPNSTTFFFVIAPKISFFVLLTRLYYLSFFEIFMHNLQIYFVIFAIISIFIGVFGGLEQRKLKTLIAYSSINNTGYLLLSFSVGNLIGLQMMFYYLTIYIISNFCFWTVYCVLKQRKKYYLKNNNKELGDFLLLKKSNLILAFIFSITLFSFAGIPPLVGFLIKINIFLIIIESSAFLISIISIILSLISAFYYIRLTKILYFENNLVGLLYFPITTEKSLLISLLALFLIIICLDPTIIYLIFYKGICNLY